jgi:polygalacturonase
MLFTMEDMSQRSAGSRVTRVFTPSPLWRRAVRFSNKGDGTADAIEVGTLMLRLAVFFLMIFAATSCAQVTTALNWNFARPNPEPALPAGCDPFSPPALGMSPPVGAPVLAEWTRTGAPDSVVAMTGTGLAALTNAAGTTSARFEVFGQNATDSYTGTATLLCDDGVKAAVALPASLPANSEYLLWADNAAGTSAPAVVNGTDAWWVGPNVATRGDTVSVYGRNLVHDTTAMASHVYIMKAGASGVWAAVTAANPYKVDFTVPTGLSDGVYQVWVHNGRGGHYGWSGPVALTVNDGMPWTAHVYNVKSYGAKGDGSTDDQAAINTALTAAMNDPWSTLYLPTGTYMVSEGFVAWSKVRWMGDGATKTFIKANANFVKPRTGGGPRNYCLLFSPNGGQGNIAVQNLTLDCNGNLNGYLSVPVYLRFDSDIRFSGVTINAAGYGIADFHGATRLQFTNCNFTGGGSGIFFGSATQVLVQGCNVYGTNDANTLLTSWGGDSVSYVNTTGQDFNNATATGWAQGRFIYGSSQWGSNRNVYIGNCTTRAMAVRPGLQDQNTGEQLLWESATLYSGTPLAASATTVTLPVNSFFSNAGLAAGEYDAVIANGRGLGQHRKIIACAGTTITVSPAWNVAPDRTSTVLIAGVVSHCAVYANTLQGKATYATQETASTGIQPYGNSYDFIADGNTISQVRTGIDLWCLSQTTMTPQSINCCYFNYVANNKVTNCLTGLANTSVAWSGWPTGTPYPGLSSLANTFTNNTVSAMGESGLAQWASTAPIGDQEDMNVFAHNVLSTMPVGVQTESSGHVTNTQSYKNTMAADVAAASTVQ